MAEAIEEGSPADLATLTAILDHDVASPANDALLARAEAMRAGGGVDAGASADLLCWAAARGDEDLVAKLLAAGVPANAALDLHLPPYDYDDEVRWRFANRFATEGEPTRLAFAPLAAAVYMGHAGTARLLLDAGADPNADVDGRLIVHAARRGDADVVDLLIARGADLSVRAGAGQSLLSVAASNGNGAVVERLLAAGLDPNAAGDDGRLPISAAAHRGDARTVRALIAAGANVNPPPREDESVRDPALRMFAALKARKGGASGPTPVVPLVYAAENGHAEVVRLLLDAGAKVAARNEQGRSAYDVARSKNHPEIIRMLRAAGAAEGEPARPVDLFLAAASGDVAAITEALDGGVDVNAIGGGMMMPNVLAGLMGGGSGARQQILGKLLAAAKGEGDDGGLAAAMEAEQKAAQSIAREHMGMSALMLAAKAGHLDAVRALLARGADPAVRSTDVFNSGKTALHFAARGGHVEVMRALLDAGADASGFSTNGSGERTSTPLHEAAENGHVDAVRLLLDRGADPRAIVFGHTALAMAATAGHTEVIRVLSAAGGDVAVSPGQRTPLHNAAANGDVDTIRLLVAQGADVNAMCDAGTPIHAAARADANRRLGHPAEAMRMLIELGGDPNRPSPDGMTPLMNATWSADAVGFLIDRGANADARAVDGTNALWWAVARDRPEIAEMLLKAGASPNVIERDDGQSPLDVAIGEGYAACRAMLEAAGARRAADLNGEVT